MISLSSWESNEVNAVALLFSLLVFTVAGTEVVVDRAVCIICEPDDWNFLGMAYMVPKKIVGFAVGPCVSCCTGGNIYVFSLW